MLIIDLNRCKLAASLDDTVRFSVDVDAFQETVLMALPPCFWSLPLT